MDLTEPHIVVHRHTQLCTHCGRTEIYSHVYTCETVGRARKLLPVANSDIGALPIIPVLLAPKQIPLCGQCADTVAMPDPEVMQRWSDTLKRKNTPAPTNGAAKPTQTIDDLD